MDHFENTYKLVQETLLAINKDEQLEEDEKLLLLSKVLRGTPQLKHSNLVTVLDVTMKQQLIESKMRLLIERARLYVDGLEYDLFEQDSSAILQLNDLITTNTTTTTDEIMYQIWMLKADVFWDKKQYTDVLLCCNHAQSYPSDSYLYYRRASAYRRLKHYTMAINDYSKILVTDCENVQVLVNCAESYIRTLDFQSALALTKKALALDATHPGIYMNMYYLADKAKSKNYEQQIDYLSQAKLLLQDVDIVGYPNMKQIVKHTIRVTVKQARQYCCCDLCLRVEENAEFRNARLQQGLREALELLNTGVMQSVISEEDYYLEKCRWELELGQVAKVEKRILVAKPTKEKINATLALHGEIQLAKRNFSAAIDLFDQILARDQSNKRARKGKAIVLYLQGLLPDAMIIFSQLKAEFPNNWHALLGTQLMINEMEAICSFCSAIPSSDTKFQRCSACKVCHYCSKQCQSNDWNRKHKMQCKSLRS